jgi:hypothetical protein
MGGEQPGGGFLRLEVRLVVPEAAEYAVRCAKACERLNHIALRRGVPGDVVAGQHNQVGIQLVGHCDAAANLVRRHEGANMEIGKVRDAKTFESFG